MDVAIGERLFAAETRRDVEALRTAYELIKAASPGKSALGSAGNFSTDLYVVCAEQALRLGHLEMSHDCLQMYFKGRFPVNQFIGRAYLCQGQLHTPLSTDNLEEFEKFVMFILKAIDFAMLEPRYYFLVYNASVLYWEAVRPYLKPGFRYCLIPSLSQIVKALKQTEEQDKEWIAELMINLLECFLDASKMKEAEEFSSTAAVFIKENAPDKYSQIFSLMVYHQLMDISQIEKEIENSIYLSIIYKMQMIKLQWHTNDFASDTTTNLSSVYELMKQYEVSPEADFVKKIPLVLELARFSVKANSIELAYDCILDLKRAGITDPGKLIEIQCLEYEYEVQKLGTKIMTYTKGVVEAQLKSIKMLELILLQAVRLGDPNVIQVVCATQWNLCLPLLQHNLHQHVRKPLQSVAEVLEQIDSMLILLRCQVHMEIARIEEDEDRIEAAIEHLEKAMRLDNNGQYQEHLRVTFNRLRLCTMLYTSPERLEDQAVMMIEQAKKGKQKDNVRKKRSLLVNAGLALAPDSFQIVLDSENEAKVFSGKSRSQISYLSAKAQHHIKSVEKVDGHLKHLGNENDKDRIRIWADLAKVARKQGVWDVCRTACRFCLLYDDTFYRKVTKLKKTQKKKASLVMDDDQGGSLPGESLLLAKSFSFERDILKLLAEIRFINAEATVHLLRLQGIELNDRAVPPEDTSQHPTGYVTCQSESDPEWKIYSSWIDSLSQYAMENFQRAAEIGEELNEAWIVHNAVVYVLNYNKHLITSGRQREIIEHLQTLLRAIKNVGHNGSTVILLMLCNALARGLILCWIPKPKFVEKKKIDATTDRNRRAVTKGPEKASFIQLLSVDHSGLPDIKAAIEICEFALHLIARTVPTETVPISVQQQIIATWVKAKQLHHQQIGLKLVTEEENTDETENPITKVLIGLEMYSCNNVGLMDFTVPSLCQLVKLALDCSWSDSFVELQTLTRLMHFAYVSHEYEIVMTCSQRILQSADNSCFNTDTEKCEMPENIMRQEMLSTAACIQGKNIMANLSGKKHLRVAALKAFVQSARYAGEAGNHSLVMFAARQFWNTCLPLIGSPYDREQLKEPTEVILKHIIKAESRNKQEKNDTLPLHQWPTKDLLSNELSLGHSLPGAEEDLTLRTSLYGLLFHIHVDKADWETALKVLDEAVQVLPRTRHRLLIFKHVVIVKARLGCNFLMDIQKFKDEGEDYLSLMWRHLVTVSRSTAGQLNCFQNAIDALQKEESEWQKVDYLLEFAEWLYCNQFPLADVIKTLHWAVDILLRMKSSMPPSQGEEKNTLMKLSPIENLKRDIGGNDVTPTIALEDLSDIKQLEAFFRAHTLMAVTFGRSSPFHQQHCLMAYACIIRIWQLSLSASTPVLKVISKASQLTQLQSVQSIIMSKKEKDKKEEKKVKPSVVKEKPKRKESTDIVPANVEEWASFDCPSEIREAFKQKTNSYGINEENFPKPTCTLYFIDLLAEELQKIFCPHLTLPVFQLAEVIASEVVECKSLSDLYHLRIALICSDLKLNEASSYHEKTVGEAFISVLEQAMCKQEITSKKEKSVHAETEESEAFLENAKLNSEDNNIVTYNEKILELNAGTGKGLTGLSFPYVWIKKAEVLIQLGLYQPARLLLSEALTATQELRAPYDVSKCLYLFAVLANLERNHGQAKALLEKARLLGGNEQFWYNSTLSLTEAVLEEEEEGKQSAACAILEHTVNVLRSTLLKRPNRESELCFMIASLEARKTLIQIHFAQSYMTASKTAMSSELPHMLQEPYNKLIQIEKDFFIYGYKNCSAEILLECADIHRMFAKQARNEENHSHYLDAYNLAQRAVSEAEEVFNNISSLFAVNETTNISIPLMRQLSNMKLKLVEILLDIFHLVITEKKLKKVGETSLHKIVEAFIRVKDEDDSTQQGWKHMEHIIGHITLAQLAHIQNLCRGCPDIKSKCLCLTGKTLHLLAVNTDPLHSEIYWKPNATEEAKLYTTKPCLTSAERSEREMTSNVLPARKCQHNKYRGKTQELKKKHRSSQNYLSQSSEVLLQCMAIAFCHNIIDVLAPASFEMLECFGQFDPVLTSQFLTLHQSCLASMAMRNILLTATLNTSSSQLAALLHFQNHLKQNRDTSDLQRNVEQQLTAISKAWKNLYVPVEHFNIMNELPSNFYIVILQHSEDRSNLYSSVIEKPKVSTAQQRGKPTQLVAKVSRFPVNPDIFCVLLEKVRLYKQQKMNSHKKTSSQNLQESVSKTDESIKDKIDDNVQDFTSDFSEIVEIMENYLKPVLSQFDFPDTREQTASVSTESGKMKVKDKDTKRTEIQGTPMELGLCVVLLADTLLMELPLEALSIFREEGVCSVSRDFSLQILYNRVCVDESGTEIEAKNNVETPKEKKPKADQKKNVKMAPINRVFPSNCLSVDTHNFKYIVDPYNEGREAESVSPSQKINEILEKYHEPFTLRWEGITGNMHVPSQAEWEQLLTNCSAFVFYGMERFLSHMLLNRLVAMNIPKCHLMILLDLVRSKQSYQRVMNSDLHKSCPHVALERPVETAMLLSLTGVRTIIANQWYTSLQENAERLDILSENLLRMGKTTGQTVNILQKRKMHSYSVKMKEDSQNSPTEKEEQNIPTPPDLTAIHPSVFNCVLYGLPNVIIT